MTSLALIGSTTSDVLKVAAASLNCMRDATLTTMKSLNKLASGALEDQAIARRCKMLLSDDAKRLKLSVDEVVNPLEQKFTPIMRSFSRQLLPTLSRNWHLQLAEAGD
jgi:hypothetical protein